MIPNDLVVQGYRIPANTVLITDLQTSGHDTRHFRDPNEYVTDGERIIDMHGSNEQIRQSPWLCIYIMKKKKFLKTEIFFQV